jgi:tRNA(adenine34) deaminase
MDPALKWSELGRPWQICLELAWEAYCGDCIPIGAVVTDAGGEILSTGRNRVFPRSRWTGRSLGVELAHAEVEALRSLDYAGLDPHTCALYTTTEPCPMCMGTFYMSGLRELNYAARDPFAGSTNLLGKTWYLDRKPIKVAGPDKLLEPLITALFVEQALHEQNGQRAVDDLWKLYAKCIPRGMELGRRLYEEQYLISKRKGNATAIQVFDGLVFPVQ